MRKLSLALVAAVVSATSFLACKDTYVDPTADTYSADTAAIARFVRTQPTVTYQQAEVGVRYAITKANPTGRLPTNGDEAEVRYLLTSLDGRFRADSTAKDSVAYLRFNAGQLPPGIDLGLSKTREGESATYLIPSYAGFQNNTFRNIPANTPIRFDVTILKLRTEEEQITDFIARRKLTVTKITPEGVRISKTQSVTAGSTLTTGQVVTVRYSGRLLRANANFDSSTFEVVIGANNVQITGSASGSVVKGFEAGVRELKVGEKATVVFPSSQGYGTAGAGGGVIGPNTPLAFDIEIVSAR